MKIPATELKNTLAFKRAFWMQHRKQMIGKFTWKEFSEEFEWCGKCLSYFKGECGCDSNSQEEEG